MDYGQLLRRAWEITWRWKVLWILGFLASLGGGYGGASNFYSADQREAADWAVSANYPDWMTGVLIGVGCVGLLVAIAVWVLSTVARGGLIAGVQQVEEEGTTSFRRAWRVGRDRFWTLAGIWLLAALPFLLLAIVAVVLALLLAPWAMDQHSGREAAVALAVVCGGTLCCGAVLLGILLSQIQLYAERAAILEDLRWVEAFRRGWAVLKAHLGPTIVVWLIFLAIGLFFGGLLVGGMLALVVPFAFLFRDTQPGWWLALPLCGGGLLAFLVGAGVGSIVQTFTSAAWTLVYRRLTAASALPQEPSPAP